MFFKQYYLGCLAHGSYLVGDETTGKAIVVDPKRDIDQYVLDAEANALSIEHVVLTHFHADFVAGHLELRDRLGAQIHLGARASAEFDFNALADGDVIELGDVYLKTLETPGHTPEGISLLVYDRTKSKDVPYGVLTGDTLFIGDVGRPDLMASVGVTAEELGGMLYDSLHEKLLPLPDETIVYPAHGAGSMCGKNLSDETSSTMGMQRAYNYALQPMSKERFIEIVAADQPDAPKYFSYDAMMNRKERASLEDNLLENLKPLGVDEVLALKGKGAQLLDAREPSEFEPAHMTDSINIGLGGSYATWAGTLLDHETPIVIIAEPGTETEAATRLGRIGFDRIAGYLSGGMEALGDRDALLSRTNRVAPKTLAELLDSNDPPVVLDVRTETASPILREDLLITRLLAQRIPPGIQLEPTDGEINRGRREDLFDLVERRVVIADDRMNQREVQNGNGTVQSVHLHREVLDGAPSSTQGIVATPDPSIGDTNCAEESKIVRGALQPPFQLNDGLLVGRPRQLSFAASSI